MPWEDIDAVEIIENQASPADRYGTLLRRTRERAGVSQRSLGQAIGVSHTLLNRSETGSRLPAGPDEVCRIGAALRLTDVVTDQLLAAAGFWPAALLELGPGDPTLRLVAEALREHRLAPAARTKLRDAIEAAVAAVLTAAERR
jgi:transcriptional regulator with XRE-family HTH domain